MKKVSKKLIVIMMALLPCFQTSLMGVGPDTPDEIPVKQAPQSSQPRTRARSRYIVTTPLCYYYNGEVSITADSNVTYINATVTRLDDNQQWSDSAIGNEIIIDVSTESGTYLLEFTLSNGMYYYGEYDL